MNILQNSDNYKKELTWRKLEDIQILTPKTRRKTFVKWTNQFKNGQKTWTLHQRIYSCQAHGKMLHNTLRICKLKQQWATTTHLLECWNPKHNIKCWQGCGATKTHLLLMRMQTGTATWKTGWQLTKLHTTKPTIWSSYHALWYLLKGVENLSTQKTTALCIIAKT